VRAENYSGEGDFSEVHSFFTYDKTAQSKIIYYAGGKEIIIFNIKNNDASYRLFNIYGQEITIKTDRLDSENVHLLLIKSDVLLLGDHYLLVNDGKELNGRKLLHEGKN
jgi:hypothetical protein